LTGFTSSLQSSSSSSSSSSPPVASPVPVDSFPPPVASPVPLASSFATAPVLSFSGCTFHGPITLAAPPEVKSEPKSEEPESEEPESKEPESDEKRETGPCP
jgi:hypothetical protein